MLPRPTPRTLSFILLVALGLAVLAASAKLLSHSYQEAIEAAKDGRIALVDLSAGTIQGALQAAPEPAPPPEAPAPPPAEEIADAAPVTAAASAPAEPSAPPIGVSLSAAPAEFITDADALPKISREGVKPWQHYSRPFENPGKKPIIAVLLTGVGLSRSTTDHALRLSPDISLAFSPYAPDVAQWGLGARAWGHETYVELPLQSVQYPAVDPGPQGMLAQDTQEANNKRLRWTLTRFAGYTGVFLPPDEQFTATEEATRPVLKFLNEHGLLLVAGTTALREELTHALEPLSLPALKPTLVIPEDADPENFARLLLELEAEARRAGRAFVALPVTPATVTRLAEWIQTIEKKGFIIVPSPRLPKGDFREKLAAFTYD